MAYTKATIFVFIAWLRLISQPYRTLTYRVRSQRATAKKAI